MSIKIVGLGLNFELRK